MKKSNPIIYLELGINNESLGKITFELFPDSFPDGVENFLRIVEGKTNRIEKKGAGRYRYNKSIPRKYQGCKFFKMIHNNYIISGDIYKNDGTSSGTIFDDKPIPPDLGEYYYPHDLKGMISLIPYYDTSGNLWYDSTFLITLDDEKPTNDLSKLNKYQIVIGTMISGGEILDKINILIKPFAGKRYPEIKIINCGIVDNRFR
jgi:cyclophilin family peptidyl-prolyl cis-trans isomerase